MLTGSCFSDDPWNQTAADNAEWLLRFKRDAGILDSGPGLDDKHHWTAVRHGTGLVSSGGAPLSNAAETVLQVPACQQVSHGATSDSRLGSNLRHKAGTVIFCSRALERGLAEFVQSEMAATGGRFPSDERLRDCAREIVGAEETAADDPELLETFKLWVTSKMAEDESEAAGTLSSQAHDSLDVASHEAFLPADMDVNMTNEDLNNILLDMNFEFDAEEDAGGAMLGI